jgi:pSer/pThr/pTyr-binding forkhead associated (FHA) protein
MHAILRVLNGPDRGQEITVTGPEFVIGRRADCHMRLKSEAVSRRHCVIRVGDDLVTVLDLGSRNGTFVNGLRLEAVYSLTPADVLQIASLQCELLISASVVSTESTHIEIDEREDTKDDQRDSEEKKRTSRIPIKGKPGKLPERPPTHQDPSTAATDRLNKFFDRR